MQPSIPLPPAAPAGSGLQTALPAWTESRDRLLWTVTLKLRGDETLAQTGHLRVLSAAPGWQGIMVPEFGTDSERMFIFDTQGRLLGLPVAARKDSLGRNRWSSSESPHVFPAALLAASISGEPSTWADPSNRPLSASEARRIAWLGVETQTLDEKLAASHGVSDQTEQGESGVLVTHVYPNSPAARGGLMTGDVLLSILRQGSSAEIKISENRHIFSERPFPWEHYDKMPDEYFDRIPLPWPPADNKLNTMLKDLGEGTPYTLNYVRDGKPRTHVFTVERSPDYFLSAPEITLESPGLQLRELTFETRRYYQIPEDRAALIVSRVTPGGRAAVAGIKPYELITEINGTPVTTASAFAAAVNSGAGIRLQVRRMHQSRVVNIEIQPASAASTPAGAPKPE